MYGCMLLKSSRISVSNRIKAYQILRNSLVYAQELTRAYRFTHRNMERWANKVAVVTGASSGIGAECCKYLVNAGMIVVGLARRKERIEQLRNDLKGKAGNLHAFKVDVGVESQVVAAFAEIEQKIGPIAVLINNAGIVRPSKLTGENNGDDLRAILDTNVLGVAYCTREAFRSMKKHNIDGHVVIINSIAGHKVITGFDLNIYSPSKHAVTAMTEVYRSEFMGQNTKVKITSISPGAVDTEIITDRSLLEQMPFLEAGDIADAVIYVLQTPPRVQIHEMIIKPVGEIH